MFKVGSAKIDPRGQIIKGVTAVKVKEVLPMEQAALMKFAIVVNDDDLDKATMAAGSLNNGHLLHAGKERTGESRHSFYSKQVAETLPDEVKSIVLGKEFSTLEANFTEADQAMINQALQMHHIRDYGISNEMKGGTKGESADYLLHDAGGSQMQYVPVINKFKL